MNDKEPLKPCPCCGGEAEIISEGKRTEYAVFCCSCDLRSAWRDAEDATRSLWNRRSLDVEKLTAETKEKIGEAVKKIVEAASYAYLKGCEISGGTQCLGWEQKVRDGTYGKFEHEAHRDADLMFGRHYGFSESAKLLARLTEPAQEKPRCEACYRGPYDLPHTCGAPEKKP